MNWGLLAYMVSIGTLTSLLLFLVGGAEQGEALALGIALGCSVLVGYPLGRAIARLLVAGELRLLKSNLRRASGLAAEHGISLPTDEETRRKKPPLSAWIAVAGIGVGAAAAPIFAILAAMSVSSPRRGSLSATTPRPPPPSAAWARWDSLWPPASRSTTAAGLSGPRFSWA